MSAFFFAKSQGFFAKIILLLKAIVGELCFRVFVLISVLAREKATGDENISFTDQASRFSLPDCSKLKLKKENDNDVKIC